MSPDDQSLQLSYSSLTNPQLLDLARAYDTLTDPAQSALRAEFSRRHLEPPLIEDDAPADLVTIRRYRDLSEGIVARGFLQSAGIYAELRDENLIRLDWQLSNFIGGLRLQVPQADAQNATALLDQPTASTIPLEELDNQPDFQQPRCPACASTEITFEGHSRTAPIASLFLLNLPLPPGRESWRCANCGAHWQDSEDQITK